MGYNFRKRKGANLDDDNNKKQKPTEESEHSSDDDDFSLKDSSDDESSEENESINSDDIIDINDNCDDDNVTSHNLDLLNEDSLKRRLTKSILLQIKNELKSIKKVTINSYLNELEKKINSSEFTKNEEHKNNIVSLSAVELSNSILRNLISETRFEYKHTN